MQSLSLEEVLRAVRKFYQGPERQKLLKGLGAIFFPSRSGNDDATLYANNCDYYRFLKPHLLRPKKQPFVSVSVSYHSDWDQAIQESHIAACITMIDKEKSWLEDRVSLLIEPPIPPVPSVSAPEAVQAHPQFFYQNATKMPKKYVAKQKKFRRKGMVWKKK